MNNTMEQLREIRANLPKGKKDSWAECCKSKRVLLQRLLKRDSIADGTSGELAVLNEWLEHIKEVKKSNSEFEKSIAKIVKQ